MKVFASAVASCMSCCADPMHAPPLHSPRPSLTQVFKHHHEESTGRTSSIGQHTLCLDATGERAIWGISVSCKAAGQQGWGFLGVRCCGRNCLWWQRGREGFAGGTHRCPHPLAPTLGPPVFRRRRAQ